MGNQLCSPQQIICFNQCYCSWHIWRAYHSFPFITEMTFELGRLNQGWRVSHLCQRFRAIIKTSEAVLWPTTSPHIILQDTHYTVKRNFHPLDVSPWCSMLQHLLFHCVWKYKIFPPTGLLSGSWLQGSRFRVLPPRPGTPWFFYKTTYT